MKDIGYVIAAYAGAALLYGAYAFALLRRERQHERGRLDRSR